MVPLMFAVVRLLIPGLLAVPATPTPVASGIPPVVWELVSFTEPTSAPVTIADPTRYTVQFLPDGVSWPGSIAITGGATTPRPQGVSP